jgi:predicted  nucleic acid-binding Zn-ribbon protein
MNTKDEFVRGIHSKLDQCNNEIDALVAKVEQTEEQVKTELRPHIEALHSKREEAHKKLHEVEQASESVWGDMKMGIETAVSNIGEAINLAKSRFK